MASDNIQSKPSEVAYSQEEYQKAYEFLYFAIERHDPTWLKKPTGPLRAQWIARGSPPNRYLIELARILLTLQTKITNDSIPLLERKFRSLLRAKSKRQYEELYTELHVAATLAKGVSPIVLEPFVPRELRGKGNEPPSPDFGIRLPDGDVAIEVTVIRFGALDRWDERIKYLTDELQRRVLKKNMRRAITLTFPLEARQRNLPSRIRRNLISELLKEEYGEWKTDIYGAGSVVRWAPYPHITTPEGVDITLPHIDRTIDYSPMNELRTTLGIPSGALSATVGSKMKPIAGTWPKLIFDSSLEDLLVKSIRNSLRIKKKQFLRDFPYILVIKLGHHELIDTGIMRLLVKRIWPNSDYRWITGVCFLTPRTSFIQPSGIPLNYSSAPYSMQSKSADIIMQNHAGRLEQPFPTLSLILNPNARIQPSQSLIDLFTEKKQFHLCDSSST